MKFYIQRGESTGQYWVTFVARNGKTIAHTENYKAKADALNAARLIRDEGGDAEIIDNT